MQLIRERESWTVKGRLAECLGILERLRRDLNHIATLQPDQVVDLYFREDQPARIARDYDRMLEDAIARESDPDWPIPVGPVLLGSDSDFKIKHVTCTGNSIIRAWPDRIVALRQKGMGPWASCYAPWLEEWVELGELARIKWWERRANLDAATDLAGLR